MTPNKGPVCVSVINMKGGVGKTTIAAMLCWRAARSGRNVLAVDLDPQANLSQALMGDRRYRQFLNDRSPSIVEVFEGYRNDGGPEKRRSIREITEEAGKNGWHLFKKQMPHSRGFPKLMRGDFKHLGNAYDAYFDVPDEVFRKIGF